MAITLIDKINNYNDRQCMQIFPDLVDEMCAPFFIGATNEQTGLMSICQPVQQCKQVTIKLVIYIPTQYSHKERETDIKRNEMEKEVESGTINQSGEAGIKINQIRQTVFLCLIGFHISTFLHLYKDTITIFFFTFLAHSSYQCRPYLKNLDLCVRYRMLNSHSTRQNNTKLELYEYFKLSNTTSF